MTLPVAVLADAHVAAGDELRVQADGDGRIVLERAGDPLEKFVGTVPGLAAATDLERMREEWAR